MAYKEFTAGQEALAADINTLYMQQTVARFASAVARTAAIASPVLNQLTMLDTRAGTVSYWNGSAWADIAPFIQGATAGYSTDAGGVMAITFPIAYASTPVVTATIAQNYGGMLTVIGATTTTVSIKAWNFVAGVPSPVANSGLTIGWIAAGLRA